MVTPELIAAAYAKAGKGAPPNGQILVRQKFKPLVEEAITIRQPEVALGTHFLLARAVDADKGTAEWYGVSMDNQLPKSTLKRLGITTEADASAPDAIARTLDRLDIPEDGAWPGNRRRDGLHHHHTQGAEGRRVRHAGQQEIEKEKVVGDGHQLTLRDDVLTWATRHPAGGLLLCVFTRQGGAAARRNPPAPSPAGPRRRQRADARSGSA
jgi:hypothetical protein